MPHNHCSVHLSVFPSNYLNLHKKKKKSQLRSSLPVANACRNSAVWRSMRSKPDPDQNPKIKMHCQNFPWKKKLSHPSVRSSLNLGLIRDPNVFRPALKRRWKETDNSFFSYASGPPPLLAPTAPQPGHLLEGGDSVSCPAPWIDGPGLRGPTEGRELVSWTDSLHGKGIKSAFNNIIC